MQCIAHDTFALVECTGMPHVAHRMVMYVAVQSDDLWRMTCLARNRRADLFRCLTQRLPLDAVWVPIFVVARIPMVVVSIALSV